MQLHPEPQQPKQFCILGASKLSKDRLLEVNADAGNQQSCLGGIAFAGDVVTAW